MTVLEGISLCVVLLLALYGCAQATVRVVQRLLRPREPQISLMLTLYKKEDLEQQVRYAKWLASEWSIPIRVDVCDLDEEARCMIGVLLKENYGRNSCTDRNRCV